MLLEWNFTCVICGTEFTTLACITDEHLIPRSFIKNFNKQHLRRPSFKKNIAPTHHRCNSERGSRSLIEATKLIDAKRETMNPKDFIAWLNRRIPGRKIEHPDELLPPRRALFLLRHV